MKIDNAKVVYDRNLFSLKTLMEAATGRLSAGIEHIEDLTSIGSIVDETGCCMSYQEQVALLVEIRAMVNTAAGIANVMWKNACSQRMKEAMEG